MSRGLPRLWKMLFAPEWRDPERTKTLSRHAMTIDLEKISGSENRRVIQVNIGFGPEFWLAGETRVSLALDGLGIVGGKLILQGGRRLTNPEILQEHGLHFLKVATRI